MPRPFTALLAACLTLALPASAAGEYCQDQGAERVCEVLNGTGVQVCGTIGGGSQLTWLNCSVRSCRDDYIPSPSGDACVLAGGGDPPPQSPPPEEPPPNDPEPTATATATATVTATATGTSTAAKVNVKEVEKAKAKIEQAASESTGQQTATLEDAQKISETGANYAATMGAIFCAEGANAAVEDPALSAQGLASCRDQFRSANAMAETNGGKKFSVDEAVAGNDDSLSILEKLEKNFGITGPEYLRRMLGARGSRGELADIVSSKLDQEKIDKAWEEADAVKPAGDEKFAVKPTRPLVRTPAAKPAAQLRDQLRDALAHEQEGPASDEEPAVQEVNFGSLEPLSRGDFLGAEAPEDPGITIFAVVRLKYLEIARRQQLHRFR